MPKPKNFAICALLSLLPGCYASHTIPLPGERYECGCSWTEELPSVEIRCDSDGCDPETCVGTGCVETRTVTGRVNPCTVFATDANTICDAACSDPAYFPNGAIIGGERQGAGIYAGPGLCSTGGIPPREFYFPEVPADAVRNGMVVAELSTLELSVEGLGATGEFAPIDGTPVVIQGGTCEFGSCPLSVNLFEIAVPPSVSLDGHAVDSLEINLADGTPGQAEVDGAGGWRLLGTSPESRALQLEFYGAIAGETVEGEFAWERPPAMVADGPGGVIDLSRTAPDPHMRFTGVIRDSITLLDGTVLAAEVTADIYVRFFSGAPVPRAMMDTVGSSTEPLLVLDGSESYDSLGSPLTEYQWLAISPDAELLLAEGVRAGLPKSAVAALEEEGYELCLRVRDGGGEFDTTCVGDPSFIEKPGLPKLTCPEFMLAPASSGRFRELVAAAGLTDAMADLDGVTWLVPNNAAFDKLHPKVWAHLLEDEDAAADVVLSHLLPGAHDWKSVAAGTVDLSTNFAQLQSPLNGGDLEDQVTIPDGGCGKNSVHRINTVVVPGALKP